MDAGRAVNMLNHDKNSRSQNILTSSWLVVNGDNSSPKASCVLRSGWGRTLALTFRQVGSKDLGPGYWGWIGLCSQLDSATLWCSDHGLVVVIAAVIFLSVKWRWKCLSHRSSWELMAIYAILFNTAPGSDCSVNGSSYFVVLGSSS